MRHEPDRETSGHRVRRVRRVRRPARAQLLGAGLVLVLAASGCGDGSTGTAGGETSTTLVVAFPQEPADWNYVQSSATAIKSLVMHNLVEPLVEKQEDGQLEPLLAESYEASEDGLGYTFTIREATFHDGSDLSADDVVYSLDYAKESPNGDVATPFEAVETIEKVDDRTVQVTLSRPSQQFIQGMSGISGVIIPEGSADALGTGPVGTGPYQFGEWRNGVDVTLTRFDGYWGDLPYFEDVQWRFIGDEVASLNALLAGDVDLVSNLIGDGLDRVASVDGTEGFVAATTAGSELMYLSLNATDPVFDDERVRQAVARAIDRQAIIDGAVAGLGQPNCVFVNPPTEDWNSDHCPYPYDPAAAQDLLAEAGAEDLQIEFKFLNSGYFQPAMEIVTAQLGEAGITAETTPRDLATYLDEVLGDQPSYQFTNLSGPQRIDSWTCPGWFTQDCVEQVDDLLADADQALERQEWADLRRQAVEAHADRAYLIPIANLDEVSAMRDDLTGFKPYRSASELDLRPLGWAD